MTRRLVPLLVCAAICVAAPVSAQLTVSVIPSLGYLRPTQDLAPLVNGTDYRNVSLDPSPAFGVAVEVETPLRGVAVRAGVTHAPTDLVVRGTESDASRSDASLTMFDAALIVRAPRLGIAQPYLAVGAGVKSYRFDQASLGGTTQDEYADDPATGMVLIGVGAYWRVGRLALVTEASENYSRFGNDDDAAIGSGYHAQHDLLFTVGLRVPLRRDRPAP